MALGRREMVGEECTALDDDDDDRRAEINQTRVKSTCQTLSMDELVIFPCC